MTKLARRSEGFALVIVLWVVIIAGVLLLGVRKAASVSHELARTDLAVVQAHWAARAGIEQAMAVLEDDAADLDSNLDAWYDNPDLFSDIELATGRFSLIAPAPETADPRTARAGLIDHNARLNVNTAAEKQLSALPDITPSIVDSILDWRDTDEEVRPAGAESGYYQRLKLPYLARNGPMRTLQELRLIKDIDDAAFFGEDADLNGVLDANEDDRGASWPPDNGDGQLKKGLAAYTTVWSYDLNLRGDGSKRVNLKTADKETLVRDLGFSDALAQAVMNSRPNSLTDLLNISPQSGSGSPAHSPSGDSSSGSGSGNQPSGGGTGQVTTQWLADHWDEMTTSDEERLPGVINVNSASKDVLMTLPEMTSQTADAVVARQSSSEGPFRSVGELLSGKTLTEQQFKAMADKLTVRSRVFEIRCCGSSTGGVKQTIVAVVDRGAKPMSILYWRQSE